MRRRRIWNLASAGFVFAVLIASRASPSLASAITGPITGPTQIEVMGGPVGPYNPGFADLVRFEAGDTTFDLDRPFHLGSFIVSTPPQGEATYDHQPYWIMVGLPEYRSQRFVQSPVFGDMLVGQYASMIIAAHLDGSINSDGRSSLVMTFDDVLRENIYGGPAVLWDLTNVLPFWVDGVQLPKSTALSPGRIDLTVTISTPEPATILLVGLIPLILALRRNRPEAAEGFASRREFEEAAK